MERSQRMIVVDEINSLSQCLIRYANNDEWEKFSITMSKRRNYLDISYKIGLLDYAEYERAIFDDKFKMLLYYN